MVACHADLMVVSYFYSLKYWEFGGTDIAVPWKLPSRGAVECYTQVGSQIYAGGCRLQCVPDKCLGR